MKYICKNCWKIAKSSPARDFWNWLLYNKLVWQWLKALQFAKIQWEFMLSRNDATPLDQGMKMVRSKRLAEGYGLGKGWWVVWMWTWNNTTLDITAGERQHFHHNVTLPAINPMLFQRKCSSSVTQIQIKPNCIFSDSKDPIIQLMTTIQQLFNKAIEVHCI